MLSVVIVSNRENNAKKIIENIAATVGIAHEIIQITEIKAGISHCYNEGAKKSVFPHLCFVHDDVLFHTNGWGEEVTACLQNGQTGMVGTMGGRYKSAFGAGWRDGEWTSFRMNVVDAASGKHLLYNPNQEQQSEVVSLDGAFLCCTKEHWQQHPFDDQNFTGFHFYDLDICLQMRRAGLKNYALFAVELAHLSQGRKDAAFLNDYLTFQAKWKNSLPVSLDAMNRKSQQDLEGYALAQTVRLMKQNRFSRVQRRKQVQLYWQRYKNWYHVLRSVYFGFF